MRNITPEEAWSGSRPLVDHFRIFGCICYAHVADHRRTKLEEKSLRCVMLGVSEESKAYRLYDPFSKKIIVSRDVIFSEGDGWNWAENQDDLVTELHWNDMENHSKVCEDDSTVEDAVVEQHEDEEATTPEVTVQDLNATGDLSIGESFSPNRRRTRKQQTWMRNYVTELEDSEG